MAAKRRLSLKVRAHRISETKSQRTGNHLRKLNDDYDHIYGYIHRFIHVEEEKYIYLDSPYI